MKTFILQTLAVICSISYMTSCSKEAEKTPERVVNMLPETRSIELSNEQRQLVVQSNAFAYNLYKTANSMEQLRGKSLVMSPSSTLFLLGMLNDGAGGETEKEITSLLGLTAGSKELINGYCQTLMTQAPLADPSVTLETANILTTANDLTLAQPFKNDMHQYYHAEAESLDFSQPTALQFLNNWCSQKTHGMIPAIFNELDPTARLILMNATYFKATWTNKFDEADTRQEAFTGENGQSVTVPIMHRKAQALYAPGDTGSTLYLPYGSGTKWMMVVILPNEGKTTDDVIDSLAATAGSSGWPTNTEAYEVDIKMPRFSTTSDIFLNKIISQMGAPLMFTSQADFTAMAENRERLCVTQMQQKAAIEVSEEGTKASAVTSAIVGYTDAGPKRYKQAEFHATRPFVYLIQEISSGVIFFIGTYRGI